MLQAMKIPDVMAAVDKEWKKASGVTSVEVGESQEQNGGHERGTDKEQ